MRAIFRATIFSLLALCSGRAVFGQSPPVLSQPNLSLKTLGEVNAWVRQPDGGYVLGGAFTSINGEPRANLARLLPDGSLDPNWTPDADGAVHALAVDEVSGAVYVGGAFDRIGALARARVAKLSGTGDGAPDAHWNPSANGRVNSLAIDPDSGAIFAGGTFMLIGGQSRGALAKLQPDGAGLADPDWNPSPGVYVQHLVVDRGAVFAHGNLTFEPSAKAFSKFDANGTGTRFAEWNPLATGSVYSLAVHRGTGDIYMGSNGAIRRLSRDTAAITADWTLPGSSFSNVTVLAVSVEHQMIYAGGSGLKRLSTSGVVDAAWNPSFNSRLRALAIGENGTVYAGGRFSTAMNQARLSAVAIDASGNVGVPIDVEQPGYANVLAVQPDGGVIVGGRFYKADGLTRYGLLRLMPDGTLDPDWNPAPGSNSVRALAIDRTSGDVFVGGEFGVIGGQARYYLAKVSGGGTGSADPVWNPAPSSSVFSLALDGSGALFVGGAFHSVQGTQNSIGAQQRDYLAKLSATGTGAADPDWNPDPGSVVLATAVDVDGSVYVGGHFGSIGGQARASIAKVAGSGAGVLDAEWNPSADNIVREIVVDGAGAIFAQGDFTSIGGQPRAFLAKLAADGSGAADPLWNPAPNRYVDEIALDDSGAVYVGGAFTSIGGQTRSYLAKLSSTGSGAADARWNPAPSIAAADIMTIMWPIAVEALAADNMTGAVYAAGTFSSISGQPRSGLAAISPPLFSDGFEPPSL